MVGKHLTKNNLVTGSDGDVCAGDKAEIESCGKNIFCIVMLINIIEYVCVWLFSASYNMKIFLITNLNLYSKYA